MEQGRARINKVSPQRQAVKKSQKMMQRRIERENKEQRTNV